MKIRSNTVQASRNRHFSDQPTECKRVFNKSEAGRRPVLFWLALWYLAISLPISTTHAQQYFIDWYKIAGGGGTSTGGTYYVSGTIGQPDAGGPMTGGSYSITSGFWSLLSAVQTAGAPTLKIVLTPTNSAIVSWSYPSSGFVLQQTLNLNSANWLAPSQTVTNNGTINYVVVSPPTGNRFYRLYKP